MTDEVPPAVAEACESHEAFARSEAGYRVTTTVFDATVTASEGEGVGWQFTVTVRTPMLSEAVEGVVGPAVEDGWFETFERRLGDAPKATRARVDVEDRLGIEDGEAVATLSFAYGDAERGVEIAKTLVEYVEGTYVEGVIPGYDYRSPVADLLARAQTTGSDDEPGGTPL